MSNIPNDIPINLTVPSQGVQVIINQLNRLPHGEVRDLIDTIVDQANAQLKAHAEAQQAAASQQSLVGDEAVQQTH